jgi:hypothetical protein
MPGAYAHITAVNDAKSKARGSLRNETLATLGRWFPFAELGCVSPDYPYLGLPGQGQGYWADQMHYKNTAALLRSGVAGVQKLSGLEREKAMVWLLGFACHMTADMTIHPIVERIVGKYEENKAAHRECEMHQDAFIFSRLRVGEVNVTRQLNTGIASCHEPGNTAALDPAVKALWLQMLRDSYPNAAKEGASEPKPDSWHTGFGTVLKAVGGTARLFPFARHVAADAGLVYPDAANVSEKFVKGLSTPEGVMEYDAVFDRAVANVVQVWKGIDDALAGSDHTFLSSLEDWDLDIGKSVPGEKFVFWRN